MSLLPEAEVLRWRRAAALVEELLEVALPDRAARLRERAGGDVRLLGDVERWLATLEGLPDRDPGCPLPPGAFLGPPELAPGARVGPWAVTGVAGRGGMGVVYEAERADGAFTRRVALKLIQGPAAQGFLLERFLSERQLLAGLDHPHIARLLDGGVTPDGRPYFAMEYVAGAPLDRWCRGRKPALAERLRLFRQVCAAVAYAHRRLVIHRDLKPGNILVTEAGEVKLLDFGIAGAAAESPELPGGAPRLLTPAYASPEQRAGASPSVAGDVYSLGVILHELLTGHRPGADGTLASVPRLRGDLPAILHAALHPDPATRYPSVEALDADLERYLAGLPVRAHPDSLTYRGGKFVRRHWLALGAGAVAMLALVAVASVAALQARRASREAVRNAEAATFLTTLLELPYAYDSGATAPSLRAILDAAVARLDSLTAAGDPPDPQLYESLGLGYAGLAANDVSATLVEQAIGIRQARGDPDSLILEARLQLATSEALGGREQEALALTRALTPDARRIFGVGSTRVAQVLVLRETIARRLGRLAEAEASAAEAITLLEADSTQGRIALAHAHHNLGHVRLEQGRREEARREYGAALRIRVAAGASPVEVANSHATLALLAGMAGEWTVADSLLALSEALKRRTLDAMHPEITDDLRTRGELRLLAGNPRAAEADFREALERYRQRGHAVHWQVVPVIVGLGDALVAQGRAAEAGPFFAAARDSLAYLGTVPSALAARALAGLGAAERAAGHENQAVSYTRQCQAMYHTLGGPEDARARRC